MTFVRAAKSWMPATSVGMTMSLGQCSNTHLPSWIVTITRAR